MNRLLPSLTLLAALALTGCAGPDVLRLRAVSPPLPDAMRRVHIAMDLEGYQPTMDEGGSVLATAWKTETSGASRLRIGFSPRGGMYDVTLLVERRSGSGGPGTPAGREDPLMQKWEKILRSLLVLEPNED